MSRLGATVYTFQVGDALERDNIDDPKALQDMVSTGTLKSILPENYEKNERLPKALHRKYYQTASGFCDTPKEVVDSIKTSLCNFDDTYSR